MKNYLYYLLCVTACYLFAVSAQATVAPYYAYADVFTRTGAPEFSTIEANTLADTGAFTLEAGPEWWCELPGSCGVAISPGATGAYTEVSVDPVTGSLGARAGSLGYNNYGGFGLGYGYISQVFMVGSDGSLAHGDSVSVDAGMLLDGFIDDTSQSGTVSGLILLDHYDPARYYEDYLGNPLDYMPISTFEDVLFWDEYLNAALGNIRYIGYPPDSPVNYSGSTSADVAVGDILMLEAMIYVNNDLGYSDDLGYSWSDFQNTMNTSLTTATPGATLSPFGASVIPLPAAVWLFVSGLVGFAALTLRKK